MVKKGLFSKYVETHANEGALFTMYLEIVQWHVSMTHEHTNKGMQEIEIMWNIKQFMRQQGKVILCITTSVVVSPLLSYQHLS